MADDFKYDVFLSHSSKDKDVVLAVAERLRADKLRVWLDEWEIRPGDNIPHKIEEGLEHSRVLVLCMSANAFGSDWAKLESGTFRFRDPLNKQRRFIPLRLDNAPIKGSLAQFLYINWLPQDRDEAYPKLREACQEPPQPKVVPRKAVRVQIAEQAIQIADEGWIGDYAFSPDGRRVLTGSGQRPLDERSGIRLFDVDTGEYLRSFDGHTERVNRVAWSSDQRIALSGSSDKTVRVWDVATGDCIRILEGHTGIVYLALISHDKHRVLSCSGDTTLRLWDVTTGLCARVFEGHKRHVYSVAWSGDQRYALSCSLDKTVRLWEIDTGRCLRVLEGHTSLVFRVAWSPDSRRALTGSGSGDLRLWDVETGRCLQVLEGHKQIVGAIAWCTNRYVLSGANDNTVRLWDLETGRCLRVLRGHKNSISAVAWSAQRRFAFSGDSAGSIRVWNLSKFVTEAKVSAHVSPSAPEQVQYTNAKVLLVGEKRRWQERVV